MFWRGVWGYLPANVVQGVVGLLSVLVFTRLLSPADYGLYALGFSVMTLAHTAAFTWLEAATARFWTADVEAGRTADHLATVHGAFLRLAAVYVPLAAAAVWFWPAGREFRLVLAAGLAAVLARSLLKLVQERRRAAGEVRTASVLDVAQTAGGFALGAGFVALGAGGAGPLIGLAAAAALCLPFSLPAEFARARGGRPVTGRTRAFAGYGLPVAASLILTLALGAADRFLIAVFLDPQSVGAYHAAYSLANRTLDVLFVWLGGAGAPAMVHTLETGGRKALARTAEEQASTLVLVTLPAAVGLALVAGPLADVMIGEGLRNAAAAVTPWIAASAFFSGVTTYYLHQAFTLARRTRLLTAAMAVPAVANIVLNLLLLPRFGLAGAAWAAAASYALGALASWSLGLRAGGLPVPWGTLGRCGLAAGVMAVAVTAVPAVGGAAELSARACVGVLVYGLAAWTLDAAGVRRRGALFFKGLRERLA